MLEERIGERAFARVIAALHRAAVERKRQRVVGSKRFGRQKSDAVAEIRERRAERGRASRPLRRTAVQLRYLDPLVLIHEDVCAGVELVDNLEDPLLELVLR